MGSFFVAERRWEARRIRTINKWSVTESLSITNVSEQQLHDMHPMPSLNVE